MAAAIKLTPLIFLPYLVLTRRPRAARNCAAAFALCEGIAYALAPSSSAAYWTSYVFDYPRVGGYLGLGGLLATTDQNLMGALARFNHATVPAGALWAVAGLIGAAGLLLAALVHRRCSAFLGVVVCATTGLIISPVTWTHHMGGWQLFAGNSFFLWMVVFLGATAASALWRTPTAASTEESHTRPDQAAMSGKTFTGPSKTGWATLRRRRVTSLPPGYRHSTMREKLTATAITSLSRWTPYLEREMSGLRRLVRPGSVCIDVGSAAGLYTAVLSRLAGPAGHVHSIEPLPFAHLLWARILNARRTANVRRHDVALGTEPGTEIMSVPVGRYGLVTGRSFLARGAGGPDPNAEFTGQVAVTVNVDTLDALCAREAISRIDFIKIDVEGAELQVLEGGKRVIEAHRPVMLVEIEARHAARYRRSPDDVAGWLLERGYTMHTWRHGWRPAGHIHPGTRNYLFRPPASEPGGPRLVSDQRKLPTA